MRFAVPHDPRFLDLVRLLDRDGVPVAQTWRAVGEAAERLGLRRPGYGLVRELVRLDRHRRQVRSETIAVLKDAASAFAAGRMPMGMFDDLARAGSERALVFNEHKLFFQRPP